MPTGVGPVIDATGGGQRWCFLLKNGSVKCAGRGNYGQLGNGSYTTGPFKSFQNVVGTK